MEWPEACTDLHNQKKSVRVWRTPPAGETVLLFPSPGSGEEGLSPIPKKLLPVKKGGPRRFERRGGKEGGRGD